MLYSAQQDAFYTEPPYTLSLIHIWHLLYSLAAQGCKGVRDGAFTFILSIVFYQMVKNELLVGFNTFLSAAAAIASYAVSYTHLWHTAAGIISWPQRWA